jgi:hypothetical protein
MFLWSGQQIFQKQSPQGLDRRFVQSCQEPTERRASRQVVPSKQRHERGGEGLQALIERFERAFAADRIAN